MVEGTTSNNAIEVGLRRHQHGLLINVKVWPEIEAFFERWSGGMQERPTHGRNWKATGEEPLVLWMAGGLPQFAPNPARQYSLAHSGVGLADTGHGYPNISFLRLVGASRPEGRSFLMDMVISRGEMTATLQRLIDASNQFYSEFLQPVNLRGVVGIYALPIERAQAA